VNDREDRFQKITALAERLGLALSSGQQTITTAESCTGGGIAEAITRIPGSSAWFQRGWVTYANTAKIEELQVPADLLKQEGAVSESVVRAMAQGARQRAAADWAIAVSGIAGPDGGSPEKPVGTVWVAWANAKSVWAKCYHFAGSREEVRQQTIECSLFELLEKIGVASAPKL
jgi:nicotinamide-nucleotide amidase